MINETGEASHAAQQNNDRFNVYVTYHFYDGTEHTRPSGRVSAEYDEDTGEHIPLEFSSRKAAQAWIDKNTSGIYHLAHGEYESPTYSTRKVRRPGHQAAQLPIVDKEDVALLLGTVGYNQIANLRLDGRIAGHTHGAGVRMPQIPLDQRWGRAVVSMQDADDFQGQAARFGQRHVARALLPRYVSRYAGGNGTMSHWASGIW